MARARERIEAYILMFEFEDFRCLWWDESQFS